MASGRSGTEGRRGVLRLLLAALAAALVPAGAGLSRRKPAAARKPHSAGGAVARFWRKV